MTSPLTTLDLAPHDDLWPDMPAPARGWWYRAKCSGTDPRRFEPGRGYDKQKTAARLCAGCPVIQECAQDALHYRDQGVIRAATFIPNHAEGIPLLPGLIARLERIAGIQQAVAA